MVVRSRRPVRSHKVMLLNNPTRHTLNSTVDKSMSTTEVLSRVVVGPLESSLSHPSFDQAGGSGRPIPSHFLLRNSQCGHDFYLKSAQHLHNNELRIISYNLQTLLVLQTCQSSLYFASPEIHITADERKRSIKGKNHRRNRTDSIRDHRVSFDYDSLPLETAPIILFSAIS